MCAGVTISDFYMALIWDGGQHFVLTTHDIYFFTQTVLNVLITPS